MFYTLENLQKPLVIGATGIEEILQNIRIIILTTKYSVPLDRKFASSGNFIDAPTPYEVARRIADLTETIEKYEPRVEVTSISYTKQTAQNEMQGKVFPSVRFKLKEGVVW